MFDKRMFDKQILVTIDDQHLMKLQSMVTTLEEAGMQVDRVLKISGIITGEISSSRMHLLEKIDGVIGVEEDQEMRAI